MQAAQPMLTEIGKLAGFPSVFTNVDTIVVLFIAWIIVIISFFVLAVQLFVSVLEFKLTTLAGFVLVPFALWGKTSFLAEKVLGNVVASGIKVLVLAVIVGIGTGLFSQFQSAAGTDRGHEHQRFKPSLPPFESVHRTSIESERNVRASFSNQPCCFGMG